MHGFGQLTLGDWIRDWIQLVAGAQALLSEYLLAMWVLTYFGRPFE